MSPRASLGRAFLLAAGLLFAAGSAAQTAPANAKAARPAGKAPAGAARMVLEPRAIEILKASSARLAAARTMQFTAIVAYESASRVGPALVYSTRSDVTLQRPDKLKVVSPGDGPASEFYYDGKVMMAFAPAENLLAVADAPATIDAALALAQSSAAIYFPFSDVMVADPYGDIAPGLKVAFYIGQSKLVGGVTTDIVAFATNDVFVQAWIGADDKLPRLMRAVYRNDPARLRHEMALTNWQIDGAIPAGAFAPANAAGAARIAFAHPAPLVAKAPAKNRQVKAQPAKSQ